jgi:DNA-directed RNA polymerase specialized sigma24 family protein
MDRDTSMGGDHSRFPQTRHSAIQALQSDNPEERHGAYGAVVAAYWKPSYKFIRIRWNATNEDAKDLTQGFFARALEKNFFLGYDPAVGSFRTYLRTCLERFVVNQKKSAGREKRGGEHAAVSLDFEAAEGEFRQHEIPDGESVEDYFQREWVRNLFGLAVESLRQECTDAGRGIYFELFRRYDLCEGEDRSSYAQLAEELGLASTDVTNYLAAARRQFRAIVLGKIRELTVSEQEFRSEARAVLGIEL